MALARLSAPVTVARSTPQDACSASTSFCLAVRSAVAAASARRLASLSEAMRAAAARSAALGTRAPGAAETSAGGAVAARLAALVRAAARAESFPETPSTSSPGFMSPEVESGCLAAVVPAAGAVLAAAGAGAGAAGRFASRRLGPVVEVALVPEGAAVLAAASAGGVAAGVESHPAATSSAAASDAPRLAMALDRKILRHMGLWTMGVPGYDCRVLKVSRGI